MKKQNIIYAPEIEGKFRVCVKTTPRGEMQTYGYYINYTVQQVQSICNTLPQEWSYSVNNC